MRTTTLLRRIIGVVLLLVIAYIHFMIIKTGFRLQEYLGVLFILDVIGAIVSALWIAIFDAEGAAYSGDSLCSARLLVMSLHERFISRDYISYYPGGQLLALVSSRLLSR